MNIQCNEGHKCELLQCIANAREQPQVRTNLNVCCLVYLPCHLMTIPNLGNQKSEMPQTACIQDTIIFSFTILIELIPELTSTRKYSRSSAVQSLMYAKASDWACTHQNMKPGVSDSLGWRYFAGR